MTQKTEPLFSPDSPAGQVIADWWKHLASDRGGRAELRRAHSPEGVALIPSAIDLITRLRSTPVAQYPAWETRLPAIAGLAAHLDQNATPVVLAPPDRTALPKAMARNSGNRPMVSELRFRRLLRTPRDELYRPIVRILAQLDHQAGLYDLADALFWWGPSIHKVWAFAYFPALKKSD
ncbi:type I-E CRISPR-associated protein Cse2/CasB [Acidithiobacillus caldus]|jgi:CRISPR system Cascade subunit CasB|uniref:Type I-E CRISPR-associated protein Cse2/CasB n=1 Tax=Acidithiobacillus caldus TaxID=33059 RepID=A0A1E7YMF8_9PROT|nr:type I-E CRISPR-associated protein Cse2/CasB [Acidithiobacillus caldus]MBU2789392.1 type I-E CRISPR-associated protein Cse2/CasB [Acidithiobacillus caldus]MBU2820318.1 type I-E CRISPR-associated protein Cse2/CasB [Acidithiobacillus caldus]OFC35076.1 type I-E CRISPR-associated protein Cse2/CasB [Acidithiobacillus caldus]OFC36298.1 type I-E CRISPR-associated protein Cse2/CasB [Acidithiobacillus caldus]OFC40586.1 type I-E CRISPR-associated protein Cse2/CasB [Acidithiobacillus caldus]